MRMIVLSMLEGKKVVLIMPVYDGVQTLRQTYDEVMAQEIVDQVIVVDDASHDDAVAVTKTLPKTLVHTHSDNQGYGANQKNCYNLGLQRGAEIIIKGHRGYQYTPKLIPAMPSMVANNLYSCLLGSRVLGGYALKGGMPLWRYISDRFPTMAEVSCPTRYLAEASSINFWRSVRYGFGCLWTALLFRLAKIRLVRSKLFPNG
jgi:glycosyltransferase involved in cell wall biosynthesis